MSVSLTRTIESPCRRCRNVHLSKEECSENCDDLHWFQEAIVIKDERNISRFRSEKHGDTEDAD